MPPLFYFFIRMKIDWTGAGMAEQGENAAGMLQTIIDSFKSHVNERISSPFAGAFVIAWVSINWKAILIVVLSTKPIEDRLNYVSATYINYTSALINPLICALIGIIFYYIAATLFLGLFEVYGYLRRGVEKTFDQIRWVDPPTYIKFKSESRGRIRELTELAADNQEKLTKLEASLKDCEAKMSAIGADLERSEVGRNNQEKHLQIASREISTLNDRCARYWGVIEAGRISGIQTANELRVLSSAMQSLSRRLVEKSGHEDVADVHKFLNDAWRTKGLQEISANGDRYEILVIADELNVLVSKLNDAVGSINNGWPSNEELRNSI